MKYIILFLVFLGLNLPVYSQVKKVIVADKETKKGIAYATVLFLDEDGKGTYTNDNGAFILQDVDSLQIKHTSYKSLRLKYKNNIDTIFLINEAIQLNEISVYGQNINKVINKSFNYSKKEKLQLNLSSFEIGKIIPMSTKKNDNIFIPFVSPKGSINIALKLYSVVDNQPSTVLYQELHSIGSRSNKFLSFNKNVKYFNKENSIFVSIEVLSDDVTLEKLSRQMKLFLTRDKEDGKTLVTKNFTLTKKWLTLTDFEGIALNLILFAE